MKTIATILAALVLMVGSAFAQSGVVAPYVDAGIGISSSVTGTGSLSASNPNFIVGAGIESSTKHLLLDVNGQFSTANLNALNFSAVKTNSYAATVQGTGYLKAGHFLFGGGALYKNVVVNGQLSSLLPNRNTFVPLIGGGFQFSRDRITALYELPGKSATGNRTVDIHNEIFVTKSAHVRLTQDVSFNSSTISNQDLGLAGRLNGTTASAGLKFVF